MDRHLLIGLLVFKHGLVSLIFATRLCFFWTRCGVWLCSWTVICINRYRGWNMLNIFSYLKKSWWNLTAIVRCKSSHLIISLCNIYTLESYYEDENRSNFEFEASSSPDAAGWGLGGWGVGRARVGCYLLLLVRCGVTLSLPLTCGTTSRVWMLASALVKILGFDNVVFSLLFDN